MSHPPIVESARIETLLASTAAMNRSLTIAEKNTGKKIDADCAELNAEAILVSFVAANDNATKYFAVPPGFVSDGTSVPVFFRRVINRLRFRPAGHIHDFMYSREALSFFGRSGIATELQKQFADEIFMLLAKENFADDDSDPDLAHEAVAKFGDSSFRAADRLEAFRMPVLQAAGMWEAAQAAQKSLDDIYNLTSEWDTPAIGMSSPTPRASAGTFGDYL